MDYAVSAHAMTTLLIASSDREDHKVIEGFCEQQGWRASHCRTSEEALRQMQTLSPEVVIVNGEWHSVVEGSNRMPVPPAVIVASRAADNRLWAEALNLGAHDVLHTPLEVAELRHVIEPLGERMAKC